MASNNLQTLVGHHLEVISSKNSTLLGINGTIVDETQHTLTIHTSRGLRKLLKSQAVFDVGGHTLIGSATTRRPEENFNP